MINALLPEKNLKSYTVFKNCEISPALPDVELREFYQESPDKTISAEQLIEQTSGGYTVISGMDKDTAALFRSATAKLNQGQYIIISPETSFDSNVVGHTLSWGQDNDLGNYFFRYCLEGSGLGQEDAFRKQLNNSPSCIFIFDLCGDNVSHINKAIKSVRKFDKKISTSRHKFILLLKKRWYLELDNESRYSGFSEDVISPKEFIRGGEHWYYQQAIPESFSAKQYGILHFRRAIDLCREKIHGCREKENRYTLVKREWLNRMVREEINKSSIVLLKGEPGAGKSTFMTQLVDQPMEGSVICVAGFNAMLGTKYFDKAQRVLIRQMCDSLGWELTWSSSDNEKDRNKNTENLIKAVSDHFSKGKGVFSADGDDLWSMTRNNRQFVVCIDGLDEASEINGDIFARYLKALASSRTRIVASGRKAIIDDIEKSLGNHGLTASVIDLNNKEFKEKVNEDISQMLQGAGVKDSTQRKNILDKCEGLFLVAELLCRYLKDKKGNTDAIASLEDGNIYDQMYRHFWHRCFESRLAYGRAQSSVAVMLALSQKPIPRKLLKAFAEKIRDSGHIQSVLKRLLSQSLIVRDENNCYSVRHGSLKMWLKEKYCSRKDNEYYDDDVEFLADWCRQWYEYDDESERYALDHALEFIYVTGGVKGLRSFLVPPDHPTDSQMEEILTKKSLGFLAKKLKILRHMGNRAESDKWIAECEKNGNYDDLVQLLKHLKKTNYVESVGILNIAAGTGYLDVVRYMIEKQGIDVNKQDNDGVTLLFDAAWGGHLKIVEYLIQMGANANKQDNIAMTPLFPAAWGGGIDVVKYLTENVMVEVKHKDNNGRTALFYAATGKDLDVIQYLVENFREDVNRQDDSGFTVLVPAVLSGDLEVIKYLIKKGADINQRSKSGRTILMAAVWNGNLDFVKDIIEKGVGINLQDNKGQTTLMHASDYGILKVVKYLIEKGADINLQDNEGQTALMAACYPDNLQVVRYLVEKGADVNHRDRHGRTILSIAIQLYDLPDIIFLIEEMGADVNVLDNESISVLMYAAHRGNLALVEYIVEKKFQDVNHHGDKSRTALTTAAYAGNLKVVRYLVDKGADITDGGTILSFAAEGGSIEIFKYFVEEVGLGINLQDKEGGSPLIVSAYYGWLNIVKYLIERKANIGQRDKYGRTSLMQAAARGNFDVVSYFIEKVSSDVNLVQKYNIEALMSSVMGNQIKIVQYLVEKKNIDVNLFDQYGQTSLMLAAYKGHLDIVKYLVEEKGADVNLQDLDGQTALMFAACSGELNVVQYLIEEKGVDFAVQDNEGKTACQIAAEKKHNDVVNYLARVSATALGDSGFEAGNKIQENDSRYPPWLS